MEHALQPDTSPHVGTAPSRRGRTARCCQAPWQRHQGWRHRPAKKKKKRTALSTSTSKCSFLNSAAKVRTLRPLFCGPKRALLWVREEACHRPCTPHLRRHLKLFISPPCIPPSRDNNPLCSGSTSSRRQHQMVVLFRALTPDAVRLQRPNMPEDPASQLPSAASPFACALDWMLDVFPSTERSHCHDPSAYSLALSSSNSTRPCSSTTTPRAGLLRFSLMRQSELLQSCSGRKTKHHLGWRHP